MRVIQVNPGRPEYYDRPYTLATASNTLTAQSPHGETSRLEYTITAPKKAFVSSIHIEITRRARATYPGVISMRVAHGSVGGPYATIGRISLGHNAIDDPVSATYTGLGIIHGTSQIVIYSSDSSTGGTADYRMVIRTYEF